MHLVREIPVIMIPVEVQSALTLPHLLIIIDVELVQAFSRSGAKWMIIQALASSEGTTGLVTRIGITCMSSSPTTV